MIAAFVVTFVAALVQGTIGLGFAVISVPILSLIDPRLVPVPQLLVVFPMTILMGIREWHAVELKGVVWVLVGRIPGALLGVGLLLVADQTILDIVIGVLVLGGAIVLSTDVKIIRNPFTEILAGIASGVSGLVSAIGGPPIAMLYRDATGPEIRANLAAIFSIGVVITIGTRAAAGKITVLDLEVAALVFPALLLGVWLSRRTMGWAKGPILRYSVLGVSGLAAGGLLWRALGA